MDHVFIFKKIQGYRVSLTDVFEFQAVGIKDIPRSDKKADLRQSLKVSADRAIYFLNGHTGKGTGVCLQNSPRQTSWGSIPSF
jgi:hypothetical protein